MASLVSRYEPARNYLNQHEKRIGKRGIQATDKGRPCCFCKRTARKVSKECLKALIATMPHRVKDLVAAKGGHTKWWCNLYVIEQEKWNFTTASLKNMRRFYIETVFVWESIVKLFQLFRAKTTPTFSDLGSALDTCFWYMSPPPSTVGRRKSAQGVQTFKSLDK